MENVDTDLEKSEPAYPRMMFDTRIPMRDGIELSADVYLPPEGDGPWPAILMRTPYDNTNALWTRIAMDFARHGYAFVSQDVRGRGDSDGEWEPFVNEARDGHDTIEWIAAQPWCTGKVGMMGGSYGGLVQWLAAKERPPHLTCLVSTAAAGRWMEELPYSFGTTTAYWMQWLNLTGARSLQGTLQADAGVKPAEPVDWKKMYHHVPLRDVDLVVGRTRTMWRKWLQHPTFDVYWRQLDLTNDFGQIDLPVLHITGWFDGDQWGEMFYWHGMKGSPAADRQWLLAGPWDHAGTRVPRQELGGRDFGEDSVVDTNAVHLRFLDHWLKGEDTGAERDAKARIFTMGRNEWQDLDNWPPPRATPTEFYFHSDGQAATQEEAGTLNRSVPTGPEPGDNYTYDPDQATPSTRPDSEESEESDADGHLDKRWRNQRDDVLVYTSQPLEEDLEITGHPFVVLYASSDCPDTDWHVGLHDVLPDGRSEQLATGAMRAAYREGREEQPSAIEPGTVYRYQVELIALSNLWKKGHRLRVTVSSANYPAIARNPNTNAPPGDDDVCRVAHNTIWHSPEHPSHLLAPVVG